MDLGSVLFGDVSLNTAGCCIVSKRKKVNFDAQIINLVG